MGLIKKPFRPIVLALVGIILTSSFIIGINMNQVAPSITNLEDPYVTIFRGDAEYGLMLSWDDGPITDLMMSYLEDRIGVTHTSFIITSRITDYVKLYMTDLLFRGFDIQSHGLYHEYLGDESDLDYIRETLNQSIIDIQHHFGFIPTIFAYPYGNASYEESKIVLSLFDVGRGVMGESIYRLGEWPNVYRKYCPHSLPSADGICDETVSMISRRFNEMIEPPDPTMYNPDSKLWDKSVNESTHKMFKLYGHTSYSFLNRSSWDIFIDEMTEILSNNRVWATSWGEGFAYEKVRAGTTISQIERGEDVISFSIDTSVDISKYPIPVTVKVEVPNDWDVGSVIIGEKEVSVNEIISIDNRSYIMFDILPNGQRVQIRNVPSSDSEPPQIDSLTMRYLANGTIFTFNAFDASGFITDINVSVTIDNSILTLNNIRNPIFWGNSTYGFVIYDHIENADIMITLEDSNGNVAYLVEQI